MNKALLALLFFSASAMASSDVCSRTGFFLSLFKGTGAKYHQTKNGDVIYGSFTEVMLTADYRVRVYETPGGDIHFFDSDHSFPRQISNADEAVMLRATGNQRSIMQIDRRKAKKLICSQYRDLMAEDEFKYIKSALERSFSKSKLPLKSRECFQSVLTFFGAYTGYGLVNQARERSHIHNWFTDHGDNFYLTIPLMAMFNRCIYSSFGSTVALGAGLNIVEEVNVGKHPLSPITKERKKTDWKDLKAGMSAVGSYAAWVVLSEKFFKFRFDQACR